MSIIRVNKSLMPSERSKKSGNHVKNIGRTFVEVPEGNKMSCSEMAANIFQPKIKRVSSEKPE